MMTGRFPHFAPFAHVILSAAKNLYRSLKGRLCILHFALCTLGFAFASPVESRPFIPPLTPPAADAESSHSFDVRHYRIDLDLPMVLGACDGHVGVTLTSRVPLLDTFSLMMDSLICDSVKQRGAAQVFSIAPDRLDVTLSPSLANGESTVVDIYYRRRAGLPNRGFWYSRGGVVQHATSFSVAAPYDARFWFPCYDEPFDKAEQGVSINVTVPDSFAVCCNGVQDSVSQDSANHRRTFCWRHRYPIATYLIVFAASVWSEYDQWYKRGQPDSVLTRTFMFPEDTTWMPTNLARVPDMMAYYIDTLGFGSYPFERYGHVVPGGFQYGGMENQTLTMLNRSQVDDPTISHEMSHMWWGDMVTCIDYRNIWLNEGFGTYCESRYGEHQHGHASFLSVMNSRASAYFGEDAGHRFPTYNPPIEQVYAYGTIYCKGAWLQHMLRYLMDDTIPGQPGAFYRALRAYGDSFKYRGASTEEYLRINEHESGLDLSWFLNEWLYLAGYPQYHLAWSVIEVGESFRVVTNLSQTNGSGAAPVFHIPVQMKFRRTQPDTLDTMIVLPVEANPQVDTFLLTFRPETLLFDPGKWILKKAWVTGIEEAHVLHPDPELRIVSPTVASSAIRFQCHLPVPGRLSICDAAGRRVKSFALTAGPHVLTWDDSNAPAGVYLAQLTAGRQTASRKVLIAHY